MIGWMFTAFVLHTSHGARKCEFGWQAGQVSSAIFGLTLPSALAAVFAPYAVRRLGKQRVITGLLLLEAINSVLMGVLSAHAAALIVFHAIAQFLNHALQASNQARNKDIGVALTSNGVGSLTGVSRLCFSAGCAAGPVVSSVLYTTLGHASPYFALSGLQLLAFLEYPACGLPLRREPDRLR